MPQFFADLDEIEETADGLKLTRTSTFTRRRNTMTLPITLEQYRSWQAGGTLIQDAFPTLTAEEREFILIGATQAEWDDVFPAEGEEDA